jgi:hypothetical protein
MGNNDVIASCERHINAQAANCSSFVKAVANDFGIQLIGDANDLFAMLDKKTPWSGVQQYGVGFANTSRAARNAGDGRFLVIGASYSRKGPGHVAVITGIDAMGSVLVYGGMLKQPENASRNIPITSKS